MSGGSKGRRWPWSVRLASLLVVFGLVLAGFHYLDAARDVSRGAALGSRGTRIDEPDQGKGETAPQPTPTATATATATKSAEPKGGTTGTGKGKVLPPRKGYWFSYGPNRSSRVALTFDDCPKNVGGMRRVLDGARRLGLGLMLFPTGNCIRQGRFDAAYARAHGHYVFNHSVTHPQLTKLSYPGVVAQLGAPGIQSRYGRPPFGDWNTMVARAYAAKGMKIWLWNLDTLDWRGRSRKAVVGTVVGSARPGYTVLMHMQWHGFSIKALTEMKDGLAKRGLRACRNYPGTTPVRSWKVRC